MVSPIWDDLVSSALVGTQRRPFVGLDARAGIEELVAGADLLATATAVWAYREAGLTFAPGPGGQRDAAPVDPRPALPPATLRSLATILHNMRFRPLLGEWLGLAAQRGERLPPDLVPDLLDASPTSARTQALAVAGPVAGWLGHYRTEWRWAASPAGEERARATAGDLAAAGTDGDAIAKTVADVLAAAWERGDEVRLSELAAARVADPGGAREFVEGVLDEQPAAFRAQVVRSLSIALSGDDEAFLDCCLKDRRKDVREAAAALLTRLPASRYARQLTEEVVPAVRIEGRLRPRLVVTPDDRARRIPAVPLEAWPRHLGRPPEELAQMAVRDVVLDLVDGWKAAAVTQTDQRWARALVQAGVFPTGGLLATLPASDADRVLMAVLEGPRTVEAISLLRTRPAPWSAALTAAAMQAVRGVVAEPQPGGGAGVVVRELLAVMALAADPAQAPAAVELTEGLPDGPLRFLWQSPLASLAATMSFRNAMHEEFT